MSPSAWGIEDPAAARPRRRRMFAFGRRYRQAAGWRERDAGDAILAACRVAGPLSYQDVREIRAGWWQAADG